MSLLCVHPRSWKISKRHSLQSEQELRAIRDHFRDFPFTVLFFSTPKVVSLGFSQTSIAAIEAIQLCNFFFFFSFRCQPSQGNSSEPRVSFWLLCIYTASCWPEASPFLVAEGTFCGTAWGSGHSLRLGGCWRSGRPHLPRGLRGAEL